MIQKPMQRYLVHKSSRTYPIKVRIFKGAIVRYEIWCRKSGILPRWHCIAYTEDPTHIVSAIQQCFGFMAIVERVS